MEFYYYEYYDIINKNNKILTYNINIYKFGVSIDEKIILRGD